jgi:radical SAM superfamily enzyme YgiQ (UPF0313 family)
MNVDLVPEGAASATRGNVILFFPRFRGTPYPVWMPLEVMTIATALWKAGYRVRVLDERLVPDAEAYLLREAKDALFVGFSARPGDQVLRTGELCFALKRRYPALPIVLGGWFPSVFPQACLGVDPLDIVVMGQGDVAVVEIAERLRAGRDMSGLPGVLARTDGRVIENPRRPLEDMNDTPRIPYDRFPVQHYVTRDGCLNYYTSRGCPATCGFCAVPAVYPRQWTGYAAERVLDEMEYLATHHGVKIFKLLDTNFFPDLDRARAICRGLIERRLDIRWVVDGRVHEIVRFDEAMWDLLARSGCRELETGGEAGCDEHLSRIRKECTVAEIHEAARLTVGHGISFRVNFILGLEGQARSELLAILRLAERLQALGERVKMQFYRYTPIPVTDLGHETWSVVRRGHDGSVPRDVESIMRIPINHDEADLFWLSPSQERRVKRLYYLYLPLVYYLRDGAHSGLKGWGLRGLKACARYRVRHGVTAFPLERWLLKWIQPDLPRSREFEWQQET